MQAVEWDHYQQDITSDRRALKRQRQKQCKSKERSITSNLIGQLDAMTPVKRPAELSALGQLSSGRNRAQLLSDVIAHVREVNKFRSRDLADASADSSEAAERPSRLLSSCGGEALIEALLTSHVDRIVVVELPSWRICRMSVAFENDYRESVFSPTLVGQSLMHFVESSYIDRMRDFARRLRSNQSLGMQQERRLSSRIDVMFRVFRRHNIVTVGSSIVPLWARYGGIGIFVIEGRMERVTEPDWIRLNLRPLFGVYLFSPEGSNSAPWRVDAAMTSYGFPSERNFLSLYMPALHNTEESTSIIQWIKEGAMARLASVQEAIFAFLATKHEAHMMFDPDSSGRICAHIHVRIALPRMFGGFKSSWTCLLKQPLDGTAVKEMGDAYQTVKLVGHWMAREDMFKFTAFFMRVGDNVCFHSRTWTFASGLIQHEGQVFKDPLEEPYRYSYLVKRVGEADVTLVGLLADHE